MRNLLIVLLLAVFPSQAQTLVFGIVPQQSAKTLAQNWQPLMHYIAEQTGHTIRFATAKDIPTFEDRLAAREYDIAYMNPFHFVEFEQQAGYNALVRQQGAKITGLIVVKHDSDITSIEQLQGQTLAFPAPAAFAASIIPRAELAKLGIAVQPQYVFSHDSVYLNVSKGFFVAGGGIMRTLQSWEQKNNDSLRVLWTSKAYTPHAIAVKNDLPVRVVTQLLQAFLSINNSDASTDILAPLRFAGFEAAQNEDWDDVRELGIDSLARPQY